MILTRHYPFGKAFWAERYEKTFKFFVETWLAN